MAELAKLFGQRVKALRQARRFSQAELAEQAGMSEEWVRRMERGQASPSFTTIQSLADALGASAAEFFAEGPIHAEEIARRLAACFGKEKAGGRIVAATKAALRRAQALDSTNILTDGVFWFNRDQLTQPPVRDRTLEAGATLKAACISMLEVRAALQIARVDNAGGDDADLIRTAARLMGFRRVGQDLQGRLSEGLLEKTN